MNKLIMYSYEHYVGYGYPEIDLMKLFSSGKSIVIIRKCVKELN